MKKKKRILICPLDWGLGHATRCIPIIQYLIEQGLEVIIAADKRPLALLKKEFPTLSFVIMPGYEIKYPAKGSMNVKMFFSIPKIFLGIYCEHVLLKKIIEEKQIDLVISDNRYGLWTKKAPCIFISHQIMIKMPRGFSFGFETLLYKIIRYFIKKYDECWIPDEEGIENLSGDLSHRYPLLANTFFIGALSRFNISNATEQYNNETKEIKYEYDLMVTLSGPEPQRSIFEEKVLCQLKEFALKTLIVRGTPENKEDIKINENIEIVSHMKAKEMQEAMWSSKVILARSGYSTIMDLACLGKRAILVPTPGQTEQEYLANYHHKKKAIFAIEQEEFDLNKAFIEAEKYPGFEKISGSNGFKMRLENLL